MNNNKLIKSIKKGGKFIFWWKFLQTEVCSSRNDDGTYTAEGLYIPFELKITREMVGKLVGMIHNNK